MKHKVVVVGVGYFGQRHLRLLSQMEDVDVVGVVDRDLEKAKSIAGSYGVDFSITVDKFIPQAQTFFVISPTNTHYRIAKTLIEESKDLFIEKPMVETPEQAAELFSEARRRGTIIHVGMIERYNPVVTSILSEIDSPTYINARRESSFKARSTDTDVTFDLMIHDLDIVLFLMRDREKLKVHSQRSITKRLVTDRIDYAELHIKFESSSDLSEIGLTASRVSPKTVRAVTIFDRDRVIHGDLFDKVAFITTKEGKIIDLPVPNREMEPLYLELRDFLTSVRTRVPSKIAPTEEEILEALRILVSITKGDR